MSIIRHQTQSWSPEVKDLIQTTLSNCDFQFKLQDKEEEIRKESEEIKKQTSVNFSKLHEPFTI
jgi:hypothetical protein